MFKIRFPYYYVPECPVCGSMQTGRYIKADRFHPHYSVMHAYHNGEITIPVDYIPLKNVFCLACGNEWTSRVPVKMLSKAEIQEQRQLRGTAQLLENYISTYHIDETRKHTFWSGIIDPIKHW